MSQGAHGGQTESIQPEIVAIAKQRIEDFAELQSGFFENLQEANRIWFGYIQSETALASELGAMLVAARSIPETTTACQEWANRRMRLSAQNASQLLADSQKLLETGARLLSNAGFSIGRTGST
jgi:hypothetical protein